MQRVLSLSAQMLRTGEARSKHDDEGGAFIEAIGLNPFIGDDAYRFLLATTKAPTQLGSSQITDIPVAYCIRRRPAASGGNVMYMLGSAGRFYKITAAGTVTVLRPQTTLTAIASPVGGMATIVDSGSNEYVLIAGFDYLLRWDLDEADDASHWNNSTGLQGAYVHPFHKLFDSVYFGNGPYIARVPLDALHNQGGSLSNIDLTAVHVGDAIEGSDVTALSDDGRYLVAGVSVRMDDTSEATNPNTQEAKIIWYSGVGTNWEWETTLPGERAVRAIVRNALGLFAIGEQTIYQIAFGMTPKLVRTFPAADKILMGANNSPFRIGRVNLSAPFGDSMIFGKRGAVFGKRSSLEPVTYSHPLQGHTDDISLLAPDFLKSCVLVGTEDSKLWLYDLTQAGNSANSYPTRWFSLQRRYVPAADYEINYVEIELPEGVGSSDVTTLKIETPDGASVTLTLSQTTVVAKQRYFAKLSIKPSLRGSKVRFTLTQSAGSPRLGGIHLYGEQSTN